jgi:predicted PurR-regulated permease PerM
VKIAGPSLTDKRVTVQILQEIDRQIEMFLIVEVFTSLVVGLATWLAFLGLGVEQAAVWGVLAGLFNSIPYFGPVIVTGATSVVAFLQFGSLRMAIVVGAVSLVITSLEGFLLTPWLTSRATRMNAVAIFVFCQDEYSLKWHFWQDLEPTYPASARAQTAASLFAK